jgi:outer membrane protein assembly factor BamB
MSEAITQFEGGSSHLAVPPTAGHDIVITTSTVRPRLWPAVGLVVLLWVVLTSPSWIPGLQGTPLQMAVLFFGAMGGAAAFALWLLFASRIPWTDRLLLVLFISTGGLAAVALSHPTFILMGYGPIVRGLPLAMSALTLWLLVTPGMSWPARRLGAVVASLLGWGYCDLLRIDGVWGDFNAQISYRWQQTDEQRYLADLASRKGASAVAKEDQLLQLQPGDWPGFRGPNRDSHLNGARIATDWNARAPKLLWKHRIGPGWSSFAAVGDRAYTQEQRGEQEAVVCFDAKTGDELWAHTDAVRFNETIGGPGPRSTPTFYEGKLYTLGAKGTLNCLDPVTGKVKWSRDIVADSGAKIPMWGFSASPFVSQGIVTVFAGGPDGKGVLGYHASSGELAWAAGNGKDGYCSTQLSRVDGDDQLLVVADDGLTAFEPSGGKVVWSYEWTHERPPRVAQPAVVDGSDLLVATPLQGMRRVHLSHDSDKWDKKQLWETKDIKPYYNDLVVYQGHVYGFDNSFFTCVGLEDGKGKWRARGYGNGQVVLLADQGLLLISTEKGEVVLVEATPERHKEIARFKAIEGKTWNHPVLARGRLFVRNGEEVACFEVPLESDKAKGAAASPERSTKSR